MKNYNRVLFVCNGNTCRSPIAATILNNLKGDSSIVIGSRGMVVLFPEPYNPKAVAVCASHDMIMPNNVAQELSAEDFDNDTLVLVMNEMQKNKIYANFKNAINVYTLSEYVGEAEDREVADPYGKGIEEYKNCYDHLYEMVSKAARILSEE